MVKLAPAVLLRWSPATPADGNVTAATTAENGRASAAEALPPPPKPAAPEHLPPVRRAGALDEVAAAGSVGTSSAKLRGCGRLWEALWRNFVFAISCGVPSWARPWKWSDRRPVAERKGVDGSGEGWQRVLGSDVGGWQVTRGTGNGRRVERVRSDGRAAAHAGASGTGRKNVGGARDLETVRRAPG